MVLDRSPARPCIAEYGGDLVVVPRLPARTTGHWPCDGTVGPSVSMSYRR
jgi:hypothetical protein